MSERGPKFIPPVEKSLLRKNVERVGVGLAVVLAGLGVKKFSESGTEIVRANIPPQPAKLVGEATGVNESKQAVLADLRRKIKNDSLGGNAGDVFGGGLPPEDGEAVIETPVEKQARLFKNVFEEVKKVFPNAVLRSELDDAMAEVLDSDPDDSAATARGRELENRERESVVVGDYSDFANHDKYQIKISMPVAEQQLAGSRMYFFLDPLVDEGKVSVSFSGGGSEKKVVDPKDLPSLMQDAYVAYVAHLEEVKERESAE
ncbi:MAG: hypothetical protein A2538_02695 [Candidatus Magasanikbacteria bacterium RIFOXYD2_FULL_41_14]|uniref:Uncharacterized protein n=1 Tax=Candidatus Magasanikbacteria bacterium RIFOXYD2_FULL_41_14 TaxID=1798709 RepID=A0A1F6PC70_9BACT|nr:MAG: hypothetical protein A2538_02695 [Candidatus Magasanikbacteria bacterium RIFOXYD2_FULL_41_14]